MTDRDNIKWRKKKFLESATDWTNLIGSSLQLLEAKSLNSWRMAV
jgi:hypothetical protein